MLGASASDRAAFLGRIAHARGRRDASISDTAAHFDQAVSLLRRSLREDPSSLETRSVLADALNNTAALHYYKGDIPEARRVVSEASGLIQAFSLASRPKALETLAGKAILDAFFGGRTSDAIELIASLLLRAIDSGWCSTAIMLGAYLVGLNSVRGDYEEAIRWHDRISSSVLDGARPNDRALLAIQAAHAYTMSGRAQQALSLLAYVKPGRGLSPVGSTATGTLRPVRRWNAWTRTPLRSPKRAKPSMDTTRSAPIAARAAPTGSWPSVTRSLGTGALRASTSPKRRCSPNASATHISYCRRSSPKRTSLPTRHCMQKPSSLRYCCETCRDGARPFGYSDRGTRSARSCSAVVAASAGVPQTLPREQFCDDVPYLRYAAVAEIG